MTNQSNFHLLEAETGLNLTDTSAKKQTNPQLFNILHFPRVLFCPLTLPALSQDPSTRNRSHISTQNSTIPLPDKGQELFSTALRPGEVDAVVVSCWTHDVTAAAAPIPLTIVGDSKTVTEAVQCSEKPKGWVPWEPLFSKQGLSSLCSLSFYCHHKGFFSSAAFNCHRACRNARNARNSFQKFWILYGKSPVTPRDLLPSSESLKLGNVFTWIKHTALLWGFPTDLCPISWAIVTPRSKPVSWVITQLQEKEQTPPNWVTPRSILFPSGNSKSNLK